MSDYPSWWDYSITIYNQFTDETTEVVTWQKTIIPSQCFWKHVTQEIVVNNTIVEHDTVICRFPEQPNFLSPYVWVTSDAEARAGKFTLQPKDIVVYGECDEEIDEYSRGHRSTDLLEKYRKIQGCLEITSVSINTMSGMILPHYNVRGY